MCPALLLATKRRKTSFAGSGPPLVPLPPWPPTGQNIHHKAGRLIYKALRKNAAGAGVVLTEWAATNGWSNKELLHLPTTEHSRTVPAVWPRGTGLNPAPGPALDLILVEHVEHPSANGLPHERQHAQQVLQL